MINYAFEVSLPFGTYCEDKVYIYKQIEKNIESVAEKLYFTDIYSSYEYCRIINFCQSIATTNKNIYEFKKMDNELNYLIALLGNKYLIKFTYFRYISDENHNKSLELMLREHNNQIKVMIEYLKYLKSES